MENSFQTSFIPKRPVTTSIASSSSKKEPVSILVFISIFILFIMILASAGAFLYKSYLVKQEESLSASLAATRDSFEKDTIDELSLFNKRNETAKNILTGHLVFSPMFSLLGDVTIPLIQYTKFNQETSKNVTTVKIEGIAQDYRSIALQADMFNSKKASPFKNVVFSNIVKDKNNNINFNLKFNVDKNLLSYEKNSLIDEKEEVLPISDITNTEVVSDAISKEEIIPAETDNTVKTGTLENSPAASTPVAPAVAPKTTVTPSIPPLLPKTNNNIVQ
jgi:hypothetical protein